jgi:hypothetical protein
MGKNIITSKEEFVNENYEVNEFFKMFGLGKKENEINSKIEKAKAEIDSFDFSTLFKEPPLDLRSNKEKLEKLIDIALKKAGSDLKSVKELMPEPFNPSGKDILPATYKMGNKILKGAIPNGFSFLLDRRKGNLMLSPSECKSIFKEKIDKLGKKK